MSVLCEAISKTQLYQLATDCIRAIESAAECSSPEIDKQRVVDVARIMLELAGEKIPQPQPYTGIRRAESDHEFNTKRALEFGGSCCEQR